MIHQLVALRIGLGFLSDLCRNQLEKGKITPFLAVFREI